MRNTTTIYCCAIMITSLTFDSFGRQREQRDNQESSESERPQFSNVQGASPLLDSPLDAASYIVGAGDIITIAIGTSPPQQFTVPISADGLLLIPSVGEISARGISLLQLREKVRDFIRGANSRTPVSVVLTTPRKIRVRVRGTAVIEGSYIVYASDRISTLLADVAVRRPVTKIQSGQRREHVESIAFARRSIQLIRSDQYRINVDLDLFAGTGDSRWNPHLVEGDEVIVQKLDETIPLVALGGGVRLPGTIEYIVSDRLSTVIQVVRGFRENSRPDSIVISRGDAPDQILQFPADSGAEIMAGDRIWVPFRVAAVQAGMVQIVGEVTWPGAYPVTQGTTRLSEVFRMAGGFTSAALVNGANLYRGTSRSGDHSFTMASAYRGNVSVEDTQYVRQEMEARLFGERVDVDFRASLAKPGSIKDPIVYPGDFIVVPSKTGTVYVYGQVAHPGHLPFVPGQSTEKYVEAAGGFTDRAKDDDLMVVKLASRQWLEPSETEVEEGDAIWVPKKVERDFNYEFGTVNQIVGTIGSLATIILVVIQLSR